MIKHSRVKGLLGFSSVRTQLNDPDFPVQDGTLYVGHDVI